MKKRTTFKPLLITTCALLQLSYLSAQEAPVTVHVETAGTLSTLIPAGRKLLITDLTVTGSLNGDDMLFIREMAGSDKDFNPTAGKLAVLDLAGANILRGGNFFYTDPVYGGFTGYYSIADDNTIMQYVFFGSTKLKSVTLPSGVMAIELCSFWGCTGLTSVVIGSNVTFIGLMAFEGCGNLTEIHVNNPVPPDLFDSFDRVNVQTCKLYVPEGSLEAYRNSEWKIFQTIETTANDITRPAAGIVIKSAPGGISVGTPEATPVAVYTLSGLEVHRSVINGNAEISLARGIYIVRAGDESRKVGVTR
jgi:hypothetical protein